MVKVRYNPFATERHVLDTRLSIEECVKRLKENMWSVWSPGLLISREPLHWGPVYGRASSRGFTLRKMLRCDQDLFRFKLSAHIAQTVASGRFIARHKGASIAVSLSMSKWIAVFFAFGVTIMAFFTLLFAILSFVSTNAVMALLASMVMLVATLGMYVYFCQLASDARGGESENEFFVRFLKETLEAEEE